MLKRIVCLVIALLFAFSVAACGGGGDKNSKKTSGKSSDGKSDERVSSGGVSVVVEEKNVLETDLAKSDFGGKSFVFYYWYEYGDIVDRKVNLFNKEHNANVKVKVIAGDPRDVISKAIASGTPYDIIANHAQFFPNSIFADLYEPLEGYIDELDYYNADKPGNGGISKTLNNDFTWKNKLYACGSAKSVYQFVMYYNKKMFQENGLEDPMELWKKGEWTWEKYMSMAIASTDVANNIGFLQTPSLYEWLSMSGLAAVVRTGDQFKENFGSQEIITATQQYANLLFGNSQISMPVTYHTFQNGKAFTLISNTDAFIYYADLAKKSSAFGRNANNLGAVPIPTGLTKNGMYPAYAAQGYSAAKGASEPSLPAAFALFESRVIDSDLGSVMQLDADVRNYIESEFAKNGFVGFTSLYTSEGLNSRPYLDELGMKIQQGEDPTSTIANARSTITRMINDTLSSAK